MKHYITTNEFLQNPKYLKTNFWNIPLRKYLCNIVDFKIKFIQPIK